jgi:hypothetical protein
LSCATPAGLNRWQRLSRQVLTATQDEILNRYNSLVRERSRLENGLTPISSTPMSSEVASLATSPRLSSTSYSRSFFSTSNAISSTPAVPSGLSSSSEAEASMFEISQQIKATLTSLLGCESVKHDTDFRAWVQEKLMEAEKDLKKQRRRRSSLEREEAMKRLWEFSERRQQEAVLKGSL